MDCMPHNATSAGICTCVDGMHRLLLVLLLEVALLCNVLSNLKRYRQALGQTRTHTFAYRFHRP